MNGRYAMNTDPSTWPSPDADRREEVAEKYANSDRFAADAVAHYATCPHGMDVGISDILDGRITL